MEVDEFRALFPALKRTVFGKPLVYLDNAATSQRPQGVLDAMNDAAALHNANIHRAVHALSGEATDLYEGARKAVAAYLGVSSEEIVFTSGTTASINTVALGLGLSWPAGSEIIVAESEHHSDIVPWQMLCKRIGASLKVLPVADDGTLRTDLLPGLLSERTRIVCVAQISNVLGLVNPIDTIARMAHDAGALVLVDGAQGIAHARPDLHNVDFYAFSGHKVYAATGVGVLYARRELLERMEPVFGGGEMIESVSWSGTTYARPPHRFEAGTQNFNAVPTLVPALALLGEAPSSDGVLDFVYDALSSDPRITLYGTARAAKIPLFSFSIRGVHHEDIALLLDKMGVAVRSGQMCAEPLMARFGVTGMVRASFAPYNTLQEAEYFLECLDKAIKMLSV